LDTGLSSAKRLLTSQLTEESREAGLGIEALYSTQDIIGSNLAALDSTRALFADRETRTGLSV
jgi:hypothetical protein